MKKIIILLIVVFSTMTPSAQAQNQENENVSTQNHNTVAFRLFPTTNMWTFIKLDTRNGKMWQVQYSVKGNRFETYLNLKPLVTREEETNDRFTLYSTQNMWTFLLLDQLDGRVWQVQWSMEPENRGIMPIE